MSTPSVFRSRLARICLVAVSCSPLATSVLLPAQTPAAADAPAPPMSAEQVQKLYADLAASRRDLPRDRFDPQAIIEQVGRDPDKLAAWVRDNIRLVPYQGCLRGPIGVLMDRQANELDRALLLSNLLTSAGETVRLAHAPRDAAAAKDLLAKLQTQPAPAPMPLAKSDVKSLKDRIDTETDALLKLIGETSNAATNDAALAALQDAWWVELKAGDAWKFVETLQNPSYLEPTVGGLIPFALPKEMWHEVTVRAIVEKTEIAGGARSEATVLEATLRPAELFGQRVRFANVSLDTAEKLDVSSPAAIRKSLLEQKEWVPLLMVGKHMVYKKSVTVAGDVNDQPVMRPEQRMGNAVGNTMGGFGDAMAGGGGNKDAAPTSQLTAEWLEYEIATPGQENRKIRRDVFDLTGPAARVAKLELPKTDDAFRLKRALGLAGEIDIGLVNCDIAPAALIDDYTAELLSTKQAMTALLAAQEQKDKPAAQAAGKQLLARLPNPSAIDGYHGARAALAPADGRAYIDRINLLGVHWIPTLDEKAGLGVRITFDVASNSVAVRPGGKESDFVVRVRQGVTDTVVEDAILGDGVENSSNTASVFIAARKAGTPIVVLKTADDLKNVQVAADVLARIGADLSAGYVVAMPAKPVGVAGADRTGWWRVHPGSGETVGVMESGYHEDTAEYNETTQITTPLQRARRLLETASNRSPHSLLRGGVGRTPGAYDIGELNRIMELQEQARQLLFYCRYYGIGA